MSLKKVSDFESIKLSLASPEEILSWSHGEVTKSETINYRTQRAEKDGLFCEKIFGPEKDWECYCGKYRRIRYKGIICDKCGVEVTRSIVRRERMGHVQLAAPVAHIWFLKGVPSKIGVLLNIPLNKLEKVVYFNSYIITEVDEDAKKSVTEELEREYKQKFKQESDTEQKEKLKELFSRTKDELKGLVKYKIVSENEYHSLSLKYGEIFRADIGAAALKKLIFEVDLKKLSDELQEAGKHAQAIQKNNIIKRLRVVQSFLKSNVKPTSMFLEVLPIMPSGLRPMVQLDGGRYASSDLNDLYRRVINRNNRLKKLINLKAPEVIVRNEKRMLQEAVDALIDNSARKGSAVMASTGQKRQLKSLADMLKGKSGRFRQNLLGKRVDYSGRSVIVVGPELKLGECGLPKKMALELFKPFVINKIINKELAYNIRGAGRLIEEGPDEVWAILEDVIQDKHILLNRAPTLHRLGIQAFRPVLIEGMAIRLHPLVCAAFNADFDGDQMAVHLPLTKAAQKEAAEIMVASKNLLKPATGEPITNPTQDIVLGSYFLTAAKEGVKGEGKIFASKNEAVLAFDLNIIDINAKIKVLPKLEEKDNLGGEEYIETTAGRIIFSRALPNDFGFVNEELNKSSLEKLTGVIIERYGKDAAKILDTIKDLGFKYATKSGVSWGMEDLIVPGEKSSILEKSETEVEKIQDQYQMGLLTNNERYGRVVEVWSKTKQDIGKLVPFSLKKYGPIDTILSSKARGSAAQLVQMSGMKGPVVNPAGGIIELPIKKSYKEGLEVLEYFISTHGARKGTADTALRTASAGYLTRRLVDVSQDVVVREIDCGDDRGIVMLRADSDALGQNFATRIFGRMTLETIKDNNGKVIIKKGEFVEKESADKINKEGVEYVKTRSPMLCRSESGVCQKCYGYDLGNNRLVSMGTPVGIVAAQAIGEPGTQLTMRTFHIGGVAGGGDITQGLPRVEEVFEARPPKGKAVLVEASGKIIDIEKDSKNYIVKVEVDDDSFVIKKKKTKKEKEQEEKDRKEGKKENRIMEYQVPLLSALWVSNGDKVIPGNQLCEGHLDIKDLFKVAGIRQAERYVISEIQKIYSAEGASISDKHIEIIVKQMFSRVKIKESGDTNLIAGDIVEKNIFRKENKKAKEKGKAPATGAQLLLGVTRVSLSTESFLSAASFQETSKVLINASIAGKEDKLKGLKENVIIGKLIPAGTGFGVESQKESENDK
jgi:DNA-directed RNA polymerase subunit beta'